MKIFKAEYADDNFEIVYAESDYEAFNKACEYEDEHGMLFNIYELNENYNEIRFVY